MLLCGAGCCLLTRGFLGAGPGRGAGLRRGRPAGKLCAPRASIGASARCPAWPRHPRAPQPGLPVTSGALHAGGGGFALHEAFRGRVVGVSDPRVVQFPRLVKVRARLWLVWYPKCRPPRQKPVKTGCYGRGSLRFGRDGVCRGVLLTREPLNMHVNPLIRTSTPRCACGQRCPRASQRVNVRN